MATLAIYQRLKKPQGWRFIRVEEGPGKRTGQLEGPFLIRPTLADKSQPWVKLDATTFDAAKTERDKRERGEVLVAEDNAGRVLITDAVNHYLQEKTDAGRNESTIKVYTTDLNEFVKMLPAGVRFIDQLIETETQKGIQKRTSSVLKQHMRALKENGLAVRTVHNKMQNIIFMLKEAGVEKPSKLVTLPDYEEEEAVPYTKDDLKALFKAMDEDDKFLFCFFLDTACRKSEVAHATWGDIYDGKFHVRNKKYTKHNGEAGEFRVKTHVDRRVPLTRELMLMIEERKNTSKWIFPNAAGNPENDNGLIRRLKRVAKQAGLICGRCRSELKKTDRYGLNPRYKNVSCSDDCQVCEQHYLHRFRKTAATHWHNTGIPIRTIQKWLGHKSLEVTMRYLGVQDSDALQTQINAPKY